MSDNTEKIKLIQEQINDLEKSGHYTEAEMDRLSKLFRLELIIQISKLDPKTTPSYHLEVLKKMQNRNLTINKR
jgi:hypothetical protein